MSNAPYDSPVLEPNKDPKIGSFAVPWKMWISAVDRVIATITTYVLPVASSTVLGGVKEGTGVTIDVDGVISAAGGSVATNEYYVPATGFSYAASSTVGKTVLTPTVIANPGEAYYLYDALLLHCNGTNGSTTFTDSSSTALTLTASGNAQISTSIKKYGTGSGSFDGTGDYLSVTSTDFVTGTRDWTVEGWVYRNASAYGAIFSTITLGTGNGILLGVSNLGKALSSVTNGGSGPGWITGTTTLAVSTWYHLALVRNGTVVTLYVNGVAEGGTATATTTDRSIANIGKLYTDSASNYLNGYVDDVRFTNGLARYTGTFTPPTAELPEAYSIGDSFYASDSLLLHGDGTNGSTIFTDNSPTPKTVTVNGATQISTTQKKYGSASMSFSGAATSWATVPSSAAFEPGTGDFTVEFWMFPTATPTTAGFLVLRDNASGYSNWSISYRSTSKIEAYFSLNNPATAPTIMTSTASVSLNTWTHIALVKYGLTELLFINGALDTSATQATHPPTSLSTVTRMGTDTATTYPYTGYIDDLRITKGKARYPIPFAVPTAEFPNETPPASGNTLASGTVTTPATPSDNADWQLTTTGTITAFTLSPASGQTISSSPSTLVAGAGIGYTYSTSASTWYRLY
jgi:hypothetical protein